MKRRNFIIAGAAATITPSLPLKGFGDVLGKRAACKITLSAGNFISTAQARSLVDQINEEMKEKGHDKYSLTIA